MFSAVHAFRLKPGYKPSPPVVAVLCTSLDHRAMAPLKQTLIDQNALIPGTTRFHHHLEYRHAAYVTDTHILFLYQWRKSSKSSKLPKA